MAYRPQALKGTLVRVFEDMFLSKIMDRFGLVVAGNLNARPAPYSIRVFLISLVGIVPYLLYRSSLAAGIIAVLSFLFMITSVPVLTYLEFKNTKYYFSDRGLVLEKNFIDQQRTELEYNNISDLRLHNGIIIPKILGVGSVIINTDDGQREVLESLKSPEEVIDKIKNIQRDKSGFDLSSKP